MEVLRGLSKKIVKTINNPEVFLIIGPRQAGKTTILKQIERKLVAKQLSCNYLTLEDPDYLTYLNESPKNLFKIFPLDLKKRHHVLIDEIQYLDDPSNFLKYHFDEYKGKIKIVATGSSAFYLDKKFKDSLAGRKKIFKLLPLDFKGFLKFKGESSLSKKDLTRLSLSEREKVVKYYLEYMTFGGYPKVVLSPLNEKVNHLRELAYSYIKKDIFEANIRQDEVFYKLFKILASQVGSLANSFELSKTLEVSKTTIDNYLSVMQRSFHVSLVKPFYKNVRKELTKMPKVFFIDNGLRNFFTNDFESYVKRSDKGQVLENSFFRQLLGNFDKDSINFWRTTSKNEVDFVVDGKTAFEVKASLLNIKLRRYRKFLDAYTDAELKFVSFDSDQKEFKGFKVVNPWEI